MTPLFRRLIVRAAPGVRSLSTSSEKSNLTQMMEGYPVAVFAGGAAIGYFVAMWRERTTEKEHYRREPMPNPVNRAA